VVVFEPLYLRLYQSGELAARAEALYAMLSACCLCARECAVDRTGGGRGVCRAGPQARVYAAHPHFGEEPPLTGTRGSGTIFFSNCNLRCEYCQNWEIAHRGDGRDVTDAELGGMMLALQAAGCHNINLVTPTHYVANIVAALRTAVPAGLRIPLVYNCGGYEPLHVLRLLDGIVDIYMPDFKYGDGAAGARFSRGAGDYPEVAEAAIREMHRQVGPLVTDETGVAVRGVLIRHLVLPGNLARTDRVLSLLPPNAVVNVMGQYRPEYRAQRYQGLSRAVTRQEVGQAREWARGAGLRLVR